MQIRLADIGLARLHQRSATDSLNSTALAATGHLLRGFVVIALIFGFVHVAPVMLSGRWIRADRIGRRDRVLGKATLMLNERNRETTSSS
jgi:hypothetical protein